MEYLGGLGLPWGFAPAEPQSVHRLVFTVRPRNGFRDPDQDIEYLVEYVVRDPTLGPVRYPVPKVRPPVEDKPLISSGDRNQLLLTVGESKTADTLADRLRLDFCPGGEPREAALQVMKKRIPCAAGAELVDPALFPALPAHCMLPHLLADFGGRLVRLEEGFALKGSRPAAGGGRTTLSWGGTWETDVRHPPGDPQKARVVVRYTGPLDRANDKIDAVFWGGAPPTPVGTLITP